MASNGLPPELLAAVAERSGKVVLVLGAGCSLESPTGLQLSTEYARDAHRSLVADGVLEDGDCADPSDLSLLASVVYERRRSQAELVEKLPVAKFRLAQANDGYKIAAALLEESAVSSVMTLNFDMAMTDALRWARAEGVTEVPGPQAIGRLGAKSVVYLHRNAEELNSELWILRVEALADEWRGEWEQLIAHRVMASPVVVFAGLGSPAAVLTETARKIADTTEDLVALVVDPAQDSVFLGELNVGPECHIQETWCAFMYQLGARVLAEIRAALERACTDLRAEHGWDDDHGVIASLCERYQSMGILGAGELRARWLTELRPYSSDDERRRLVADVLLAVGVVEQATGSTAALGHDGVVTLTTSGGSTARILGISGLGTARWSSMEAQIQHALARLPPERAPDVVLVGAVTGPPRADISPPAHLIVGESDDSILGAHDEPVVVSIDEVRADPSITQSWVA